MSKKSIRLFFSKRRNGKINFGDDISPILFEAITGRHAEHARVSQCEYSSIGSILEMIEERRKKRLLKARFSPIRVWGSGFLHDGQEMSGFLIYPLAVRGKLSRDRLKSASNDLPVGDPGLLFNRLYRPKGKSHKWGLVPHYTDESSPLIDKIMSATPDINLIPVDDDPVETLKKIAACEYIASTSLHGLIAADCYHIPNWRLALNSQMDGSNYKFNDYASAIERSDISAVAAPVDGNLDHLLKDIGPRFEYFPTIAEIGSKLENSLLQSL